MGWEWGGMGMRQQELLLIWEEKGKVGMGLRWD